MGVNPHAHTSSFLKVRDTFKLTNLGGQGHGEREFEQHIERSYSRGVKVIFTGGHITFMVAFKGPNVILGLYKCNYSLTVKGALGAAAG